MPDNYRYAGYLYWLDPEIGTERIQYETEGQIDSTPTVTDQSVYFGTTEGAFHKMSTAGSAIWDIQLRKDARIESSAVSDGERVYVTSTQLRNGSVLHALNTTTGEEWWRFDLPADSPRDLAYDMMLEYGPVVELHILSETTFERHQQEGHPIVKSVVTEGRTYA